MSQTETEKDWIVEIAALPVGSFLSEPTFTALLGFLNQSSGSQRRQRGFRVLEFFKALDWLPLESIQPNPLKQQLSKADYQRIQVEIQAYLQHKNNKRQDNKIKREDHKQRVFEYFRIKVSPADKALLESLRDYELDRTGEDLNWKHYFWFTSFKQINLFNTQTPAERQKRVAQFKHDVDTRAKNEQRLRNGTYASYYWGDGPAMETFDDWLNRWQYKTSEDIRPARQGTGQLAQAYAVLELKQNAPMEEVRKQFRQMTLRYHPDMNGGSSDKMKQVLDAYHTIKGRSRASS